MLCVYLHLLFVCICGAVHVQYNYVVVAVHCVLFFYRLEHIFKSQIPLIHPVYYIWGKTQHKVYIYCIAARITSHSSLRVHHPHVRIKRPLNISLLEGRLRSVKGTHPHTHTLDATRNHSPETWQERERVMCELCSQFGQFSL